MPSMNQKVQSFLFEQQEYITSDCINAMITLYKRGATNITFLGELIEVKQHKMTPIIAVIEAFGFVELYKAGQSKEYIISDFGIQYLKLINRLPAEEKTNEKIHEEKTNYILETPTVDETQLELLSRILRLISLGKRNSMEEIAETIQIDLKEVKQTLQHLTLSEMVKNTFQNRVRRYQLTDLGQLYYLFIKGKDNEKEIVAEIKNKTPRIYDTLVALKEGQVLYKDEVEYLQTLGLAKGTFLTEQGKKLAE